MRGVGRRVEGVGGVGKVRGVGRVLGGFLATCGMVEPLPAGGAAVERRTEFPISATSSYTLLKASSSCVASSPSWLLQVAAAGTESAQLEQERKLTARASVLKKCNMVNIAAGSLKHYMYRILTCISPPMALLFFYSKNSHGDEFVWFTNKVVYWQLPGCLLPLTDVLCLPLQARKSKVYSL